MNEVTPDNAARAPEDFHDRLYGLTFKLLLNPNEDAPNNEVRLVLGATVGSGESEVAYFHAEQGVLHDAATVTALEAEVERLQFELDMVRGHYEQQTAYAITHKGALRYCNSSMRDAYSDEKVRADAAERRVAELEDAARAARGRLIYLNSRTCQKVDADLISKISSALTGAGAK